jgi:hypothetical protein
MRVSAILLMVSCALSCRLALADDAPAAVPAATQDAPATPAKAAAPPAAAQSGTPATPSLTKSGVTVVGTRPELTPDEKDLLNRGYKLEMHDGAKYFCVKEQELGSRFVHKYCDTAQSIQARRAESQEAVRVIQSNNSRIGN